MVPTSSAGCARDFWSIEMPGETLDEVHVRFVHLAEELARVGESDST